VIVAHPAESLHTALQRMTRAGISRLPVVERDAPERLIGIVSMRDLASVLDLEVAALADRDRVLPVRPTDDPLASVIVGDVMQRSVEIVRAQQSVERVANRLAAADAHAAAVVDEDGVLAGIVTMSDIVRAANDDPARPVAEIMQRTVITARPSQRVADALAQPGAEGLRQLLVVEGNGRQRRTVGLLRRSDVVAAYLRARDREAQIIRHARTIEAQQPGGAETAEAIVREGAYAAGRTLSELRLPPDVVVTRVVRRGDVIIPRGSVRLETADRVHVLGAPEALRAALRRFEDGLIADIAAGTDATQQPLGAPPGDEARRE
jgi:CBS domain-containing protein